MCSVGINPFFLLVRYEFGIQVFAENATIIRIEHNYKTNLEILCLDARTK